MVADEELHVFFTRLLRDAGPILYGRVTYELMVPFWPDIARNPTETESINEFARVFDSLDKIVFSTTLKKVEGSSTRLLHGDLEGELRALREEPGKDIFIGSLSLASQLSELGLIDEYYLAVHPVLAGKGPRLFDSVTLSESLFLDFIGLETLGSGVVVHHYKKSAARSSEGS
jgi:dihydrofolate reductase